MLRRATLNDAKEIARLESEIFKSGWTLENVENMLKGDSYAVVEEVNGEIIAYASYYIHIDEGDINNVAVTANYRKQGIGKSLVNALLQDAKARGVNKLFLEVRENNITAIKLYESFNFKQISVRKKYYNDGQNALIYQLVIN